LKGKIYPYDAPYGSGNFSASAVYCVVSTILTGALEQIDPQKFTGL